MRKIAIFVEGQTAQIFIKTLLEWYYQSQGKITTAKIYGQRTIVLKESAPAADTQHYFFINDAGSDERVGTAVFEEARNLLDHHGYEKVIGLRDLWPKRREVLGKFLETTSKMLQPFSDKAKILLSIMEIEAWFLADKNLFSQIDTRLTPEFIKERVQTHGKPVDLLRDDPELAYEHPAKIVEEIYALVGKKYGKKEKACYEIARNIDYFYLCQQVQGKKIACFFRFLQEMTREATITIPT